MPHSHRAMRLLTLLSLVVLGATSVQAQGARPNGSTTLLSGVGSVGNRLGYHTNVRQRLLTASLDSLHGPLAFLPGTASVSAEALYQFGLVNDGSPWVLGGGFVSRWSPAPQTWPVRPYFVPLTVGVFADGTEPGTATQLSVGIGNGLGVEVPIGSAVFSLESRVVSYYQGSGRGGGSIPISVGVTF